jgi:phosphoglycerate dehydrogenase-like enzyme
LRESFLSVPESVALATVPHAGKEYSPALLKGIDALLMGGGQMTAASLDGVDRLAVVCRFGVGYDTVDLDACAEAGVVVANAPEGVRKAMAHTAIGFVLTLAHRLFDQDRALRGGGDWASKHEFCGYGLVGKTLGVIGLGNIGREIVRIATVLDCEVLGYDPYAPVFDSDVERVELDDLMRRSDYIVVQCALTPETRGLIGGDRLALMKPSAYLINTARGPVVDEDALIETLRNGRIAGAALDVFAQEPTPRDNPLLTFDNVIVTPHSAGWTDFYAEATAASISATISSVASGELPINTVNRHQLIESGTEPRYLRYRAA